MCGRFTLTERNVTAVARFFAADVEREQAKLYRPRWNVAPTDEHWVVRTDESGRRRLLPARFGFELAAGQPVINARSETAATLPAFRRAFAEGRCLVPADGFYEWQGGRAERRPLWFHDPSGQPLAFAGLAIERQGALAFRHPHDDRERARAAPPQPNAGAAFDRGGGGVARASRPGHPRACTGRIAYRS